MAKAKGKIIIDGVEISVEKEDISFRGIYDLPYSLVLIEKFIEDAGSDDLGVFGGTYEGGIHCQQVPDEIASCIHVILESEESIKSYLEIGVAAGGTTFLFNRFFHPEQIILIDDNKHYKAKLRVDILKNMKYTEIIGNSQDEESVRQVSAFAPFDIILIDGDHSYAGMKLDTILYLPYLRVGGFLILHDSALLECGGVRVVRELKADKGMEFIGEYISKKHKPCGIALFRRQI